MKGDVLKMSILVQRHMRLSHWIPVKSPEIRRSFGQWVPSHYSCGSGHGSGGWSNCFRTSLFTRVQNNGQKGAWQIGTLRKQLSYWSSSEQFSNGRMYCTKTLNPETQVEKEEATEKPTKKKGQPNAKNGNNLAETVVKVQNKRAAGGAANTLKRPKRKATVVKTVIDEYGYDYDNEETFPITAYALCEEFDMKEMHKGLIAQGLYIPSVLSDDLSDVIHVVAKYPIGNEPREIFFFREGAVVFWNVPYLERVNVLKFLKEYQDESYMAEDVEEESEYMSYTYVDQGSTRLVRGRVFLSNDSANTTFKKYAFANALASSVKLGIWEATLEKYVDGIEHITETLKRAEKIRLTREEVLQKIGELFALRHQLNLNSDLLDTPDFYWEREHLATFYQKTCDYLSITRRTKVMNERLNQCCEILDLISSHLTDQHHTRLEWMIIVLIMIEVGFEIFHLLERFQIVA